jgi:hypothetical protein
MVLDWYIFTFFNLVAAGELGTEDSIFLHSRSGCTVLLRRAVCEELLQYLHLPPVLTWHSFCITPCSHRNDSTLNVWPRLNWYIRFRKCVDFRLRRCRSLLAPCIHSLCFSGPDRKDFQLIFQRSRVRSKFKSKIYK